MYERFYKLREKPFNMTPDPEYLFFTEKHKEAFAHLVYGIRERRGFIEITGEIGAGKTTLCRSMLNEFDPDTKIALILNPFLSDVELLRTINEELYIDSSGPTKKELLDALNRYLIDQHAAGRNVVLVIDEAQNLSPETLEQIRIISNLETVKAKLIQIVLVGQPELRQKLARRELRQLNQRITVRYHISPLSRSETEDYIFHRLKVAGDRGEIQFTPEAIEQIYKYTGGVPRMINILCDHALLSGFVFETYTIDVEIIKKAWREIEGRQLSRLDAWTNRLRGHSLAYGALAAALLISLAFFAGRGTSLATLKITGVGKPAPTTALQEIEVDPQSENAAGIDAPGHKPAATPPIQLSGLVDLSILHSSQSPAASDGLDEKSGIHSLPVEPQQRIASVPAGLAADATASPAVVPADPADGPATVQESPAGVSSAAPATVSPETATPVVTVQAEPGKFDSNGVLRCAAASDTRAAALLTLARLWISEATPLEKLFAERGQQPDGIEKAFEPMGLAPISWSTSLAMVRAINLPAVMEVYEGLLFAPTYVTLMAFEGNQVVLGDPRVGIRRCTQQELNEQWFGRLTMLVPQSVKTQNILGPASRGEEVRLLQVRLKKLGFFDVEPNGLYSSYTLEQVKRFQQQNRIKTDGLVGLETNLVLFSRLAGAGAPRLGSPTG